MPGLLQSEGYVRALYENDIPPLTGRELEELVTARVERQRLLYERPNTTFDFIVEEAVFMRRLGGVEVTRELLDLIFELASLRNVTLQIMPRTVNSTRALPGPFG
ncbi:hypothetical protein GCM10017744_026660 [Streptomyces antimycoticus]